MHQGHGRASTLHLEDSAVALLLSDIAASPVPPPLGHTCMIQEALLSPGCTLAVNTTPTLALSSLGVRDGAVTVSRSQELPRRIQRVISIIMRDREGWSEELKCTERRMRRVKSTGGAE